MLFLPGKHAQLWSSGWLKWLEMVKAVLKPRYFEKLGVEAWVMRGFLVKWLAEGACRRTSRLAILWEHDLSLQFGLSTDSSYHHNKSPLLWHAANLCLRACAPTEGETGLMTHTKEEVKVTVCGYTVLCSAIEAEEQHTVQICALPPFSSADPTSWLCESRWKFCCGTPRGQGAN